MKLKDFFYFNRSDRSIVIFFLVLFVVAIAVVVYLGGDDQPPLSSTQGTPPADSLHRYADATGRTGGNNSYYRQDSVRRVERFPFDPNTADSTQLLRLGLQPWQVRNIYRYRAAGGVYSKPSDFANLYGLTQKQYRELEPYIRISADYQPAADRYGTRYGDAGRYGSRHGDAGRSANGRGGADGDAVPDSLKPHYPQKLQLSETIDLNTADTTLLKRVPGIGSYYARRIATYRQRLGGFYSADQLLEIEDFPEKALAFFKVSGPTVKLAVNRLTLNQLKRHPYISYYQAKAIVDYRRLRGPLKSLADLRLLSDFKAKDMERLSHYVEF